MQFTKQNIMSSDWANEFLEISKNGHFLWRCSRTHTNNDFESLNS